MKRRRFIAAGTAGFVSGGFNAHKGYTRQSSQTYREPERELPIAENTDVIVCGGGPAGFSAALASARVGAKTRLLELKGCLGGTWTVGLVNCILDSEGKKGIIEELEQTLGERGGMFRNRIDPELTKLIIEEMCLEAGVSLRYHTRVVGAVSNNGRLASVITESKAGREVWNAKVFIDCTGDGDCAAYAGCRFDIGHPETGSVQPMSFLVYLSGIGPLDDLPALSLKTSAERKDWMYRELKRAGIEPSYSRPTFYGIRDDLAVLMANHQYNVDALDPDAVTRATVQARAETAAMVYALRSLGGRWKNIHIVATPEQIGIRESRRIHGRYTVTVDDLMKGARFDDAVCHVRFGVDIHSIDPGRTKGILDDGIKTKPYDIPLRSLIARDVDGLMMAGRNISGDFFAHASYRVTGDSVMLGEAAGKCSAKAALGNRLPHEISIDELDMP
ncbi:MAG: FAD-dependent oxidoreductase [Candidatus Latescibacteria bacterium]|nr:FAD-dependent oxidoreductase [Candidatus Latescibacterota bacterium]